MNELILIMTMLATIAYVAQPYWRKAAALRPANNVALDDLLEQRDSLLAQIKEIEFDQQVGKISVEDYAEINRRYRAEIIAILRRIDVLQGNKRSNKKLERELQRARDRRKQNGPRSDERGTRRFCIQCGRALNKIDRFCAGCGQSTKP